MLQSSDGTHLSIVQLIQAQKPLKIQSYGINLFQGLREEGGGTVAYYEDM